MDVYYDGDCDPKYKGTKFTYLTICDCTSRVLEIIKVRSLTAISIVNAILKAHIIIPFLNLIWMTDRGTHFMKEAKKLLSKLVGNRFQMNYAGSHQSQAILERIHEEVNRHLRPLLNFIWRVVDGTSEEITDAGVYMSGGIYNRMPASALGFHCPIEIFTPLAEVYVQVIGELDNEDDDFEYSYIEKLYELHSHLFGEALMVMERVNAEYIATREVGRRFNFDIGDLCLVRYDPAPGKSRALVGPDALSRS